MIADRYYFYRLSEKEKRIYTEFYRGVILLRDEITLPMLTASADEMQRVFLAVILDNPFLYYLNQSRMNYSSGASGLRIYPKYWYSAGEVKENNEKIQLSITRILSSLHLSHSGEEEKERRIHDYLVRNTAYDAEALQTEDADAHSVVGVFSRHRAVCEGTAKTVKLLLNMCNVKCIVVTGRSDLHKGGRHAWNIVKIGGKPYHLDVTWDICASEHGNISYDYYNLPDEAVGCDHSDFSGVPECTSWNDNYHMKQGLLFGSFARMQYYLVSQYAAGKKDFYFRVDKELKPVSLTISKMIQSLRNEMAKRGEEGKLEYTYNEPQSCGRIRILRM